MRVFDYIGPNIGEKKLVGGSDTSIPAGHSMHILNLRFSNEYLVDNIP